jgi:hypothetical protein
MRSIIKSALRVFVCYIFIRVLISFVNNFFSTWNNYKSYHDYGDEQHIWLELALLIAGLLVSAFILWIFWWKAGSLTKLLAGNIEDNKLFINIVNTDLIRLALLFIGVILVISSIPDLVGLIGYHIRLTNLSQGMTLDLDVKANELKFWIVAIASIVIGLGLVFGIKHYWRRWSNIRKEKKGMIHLSRSFSITKIEVESFDPEKSYPVLAINMDQYQENNAELGEGTTEGSESQSPQEIAFFLVGDDNGEFVWIAEDECRLAPVKE